MVDGQQTMVAAVASAAPSYPRYRNRKGLHAMSLIALPANNR